MTILEVNSMSLRGIGVIDKKAVNSMLAIPALNKAGDS